MSDGEKGTSKAQEQKLALGLFAVFLLILFVLLMMSLFDNDIRLWWSLPLLVIYTVIGAVTAPLSKALVKFMDVDGWNADHQFHRASVVGWLMVLPAVALAAFFIAMGRITR